MVEVKLQALADLALISQEGKLSIIGIFSLIRSTTVPAQHPQMYIVVMLEADSLDAGKDYPFSIELIDPDGKNIIHPLSGTIKFAKPAPGEKAAANILLGLNNINFPVFGDYAVKIRLNNEVRGSIPLKVIELKQK